MENRTTLKKHRKKMFSRLPGFTLIELLIVIVIIAALATSVFIAFNPQKRFANARNARRIADTESIRTAINQYVVDKGTLPVGLTAGMQETQIGTSNGTGVGASNVSCVNTTGSCNATSQSCVDLTTPLASYLKTIPNDPKIGSTSATGYSVSVDSHNIITVNACGTETLAQTTPTPTVALSPAFYVATNGNDSNPGTLASPFATLSKCKTAMENSTTIKTCYIRGGTYYPANVGADCSQDSTALRLNNPQDQGQSWSYYPPDGYDSAIIDGGASSATTGLDGGICEGASNITINGLQLQHFEGPFIHVFGNNNIIENNIVHDSYYQPFTAAIKMDTISQNTHVLHNVVYNVMSNGISAHSCNGGYGGCAQGITNDVVEYNYVYNYCYNDYDCGAIEFQDYDTPRSTNILAAYNYVQDGDLVGPGGPVNDGGGIGGGRALYMDDGTSNVTYQGNIVTGKNNICVQIHGGSNDTYKNNICDIQTPAANQNIGNTGMNIVYFQNSSQGNGMTNDHADNNIIIGNDPSGGAGYGVDSAPTALEISNNAYHNYVTGPTGSCYIGGMYICGGAGTESSPQNISNLFNPCPVDGADSWSFELNSSSTALLAPVNFPQPADDRGDLWGRPGFWGPPGYHISHTGYAPSYKPC
jgi:prepilin-type N-terminal cleavage/methylation domain-containing protein